MTPIAILCLSGSVLLIGGGLVASVVALVRRPERADYPDGGTDED